MAYLASMAYRWRISPDLAMPNSARHRRDARRREESHQRASPRTRRRSTSRRKKKTRTPRCGQIQLRPRLEEAERVVHDDVRGRHAHERRDRRDLGRREHRRRGRSATEPGGVIGRNAHGPRLLQSCPGPVPHDWGMLMLRSGSVDGVAAQRRDAARACGTDPFLSCLGSLLIGPPRDTMSCLREERIGLWLSSAFCDQSDC